MTALRVPRQLCSYYRAEQRDNDYWWRQNVLRRGPQWPKFPYSVLLNKRCNSWRTTIVVNVREEEHRWQARRLFLRWVSSTKIREMLDWFSLSSLDILKVSDNLCLFVKLYFNLLIMMFMLVKRKSVAKVVYLTRPYLNAVFLLSLRYSLKFKTS